MKDLVIDLVACCENRISTVEELITGAYYATVPLDASLGEVAEERSRLSSSLQDILARNCSFRKKDFNALMEKIIFEAEAKKRQIEEERRLIRAELEGYLSQQKQLAISLKQQLVEFNEGKADTGSLESTVERFKSTYQQRGQAVFALLRDFQLHLESFQKDQQEINQQLRRLVDRDELLRIEDLRQLEVVMAGRERKTDRQLRRQEVERLLAQFRQQRQGG
ncbi:MAG: hypothetical protein Q8O55_05075 [Dehalococcoidales bacterium]|nr:hypothetical protein [Dehalococcoidales bacterium]